MAESNYVYDSAWSLQDAGLVAASAAGSSVVDGGLGALKGEIVIDVSALEIASNDELYDIVIQGSTVAAFATDTAVVELGAISMGAAETKRTDANGDDAIGRFILPFTNERNGTIYRYLRLYIVVAGTIATGINFTAFASIPKPTAW